MLTVTNQIEKWRAVLTVTIVSVVASVGLTWGLLGELPKAALIAAVSVPLCVAPVTSIWTMNMMLKIHDLNTRLTFSLRHDGMTGLMNRRAFFDQLGARTAPPDGTFMMADIDHFKSINDQFGHQTGDQIIKAVAQILEEKTHPDGMAARFGGEEFAIFCAGKTAEQSFNWAEQVRQAVGDIVINAGSMRVTTSISIGLCDARGHESINAVLGCADRALYVAKNKGRNQVSVWSSSGENASESDAAIRSVARAPTARML